MAPRSAVLVACALLLAWPVQAPAQVSASDLEALLALHDAERCAVDPPAAAMPAMSWDANLAAVAQAYANGCAFAHNANRTTQYQQLGGSGYVGENIAWGTAGYFSLTDLAQLWADEKASWTYGAFTGSGPVVGHYTQMIWADTTAVGCGAASCSGSTFLVCDYAPGGNYLGQTPYDLGSGTTEACAAPEPGAALAGAAALAALAQRRRARARR